MSALIESDTRFPGAPRPRERNKLHERFIGRTTVEVRGEFDTLELAAEARRDYLCRFMPEGYMTALRTRANADGFYIEGSRAASCE